MRVVKPTATRVMMVCSTGMMSTLCHVVRRPDHMRSAQCRHAASAAALLPDAMLHSDDTCSVGMVSVLTLIQAAIIILNPAPAQREAQVVHVQLRLVQRRAAERRQAQVLHQRLQTDLQDACGMEEHAVGLDIMKNTFPPPDTQDSFLSTQNVSRSPRS